MIHQVLLGDCLDRLDDLKAEGRLFDLIYLDPPFGTQKKHELTTRDGRRKFGYQDIWQSQDDYGRFLYERVYKMSDSLKDTGSLFFHCDSSASHIARSILDEVFGPEAFVSEIIWSYRRWSNSQKGLIPSHQTIYFYAKTKAFKFNQILTDYSETTNADQILQRRIRDKRGKAVYERDEHGEVVLNGVKRGVPLGDVWEIPYLNPKAAERVGYPTQKPILLLERIIELVTSPGDWVLDPFCGSGTTLVAAKLNNRNAIGIDALSDAVSLATERLQNPTKSSSYLMNNGRSSYLPKDADIHRHIEGLDYVPVPRNKGIDGILKNEIDGKPVFIRVQRDYEALSEAAQSLKKAAKGKGSPILILVQTTQQHRTLFSVEESLTGVRVIPSMELLITDIEQDI
jgi:site-specific DNA-methyltransferase (adenine-specific)